VNVAGYATSLGRHFRQTVILIGCGLESGQAFMRWKHRGKSRKSFTVTTLQLENLGLLRILFLTWLAISQLLAPDPDPTEARLMNPIPGKRTLNIDLFDSVHRNKNEVPLGIRFVRKCLAMESCEWCKKWCSLQVTSSDIEVRRNYSAANGFIFSRSHATS
jgi:hypothetical protein